MAGSRTLAVAVVILVVLAGCSGLPGGAPNGTDSGADGSDGVDPSVDPIYETPLNSTEVAVEHTVALRSAGSFAYSSTVDISGMNDTGRYQITRTADVNMDSGNMLVHRSTTGVQNETVYVDNGTTYARTETIEGNLSFDRSNQSISTSTYSINGVPDFLDAFELSYDGATTENGERVYRYSASGLDEVASPERITGDSARNITDVEAVAFVTEDGVVNRLSYTLTFDTDRNQHTIQAETTYTRLGETDVNRPDWTEYADAAAEGTLTETRTITNESIGASLQVTAKQPQFDRIAMIEGAGPFHGGNGSHEAAAVSNTVTVILPPDATNASLTLQYDASAIPDGNESALKLYQYDVSANTWNALDATHDAEADSFTADIDRSNAFVVLHEPTWNSESSETE